MSKSFKAIEAQADYSKMIIENQLYLCQQRQPAGGMLSLDQFRYEAYNTDFGPLTLNDVILLTTALLKRA